MKKRIVFVISILAVLVLGGTGVWASLSGKLASVADIISSGPAEIDIFTKDANGDAVGFVDILVSSDNINYSPADPPLQTQGNGHVIYSDPVFQNHTLYLKASKPYHSVSPEYRQLSVSSGNRYNTEFTVTPINQDSTKGKLKGKVTESGTNNPINGAYIAVAKGTQVSNTGYSNAQGDYSIANIVPDTYTIISYRNGYQRKETPNITITANQETTLDISLSKETSPTPTPTPTQSSEASIVADASPSPLDETFSFVAEIVDRETGQKIEGAEVSITPEYLFDLGINAGEVGRSQDKAIDTSKYGESNVKVSDISYPGATSCISATVNYKIKIIHPNYQTYESTFECKGHVINYSGENLYKKGKVELSKGPTFEYAGKLSDKCLYMSSDRLGGEIEGASITVFDSHYKDRKYSALSDSRGKFEIKGIPFDTNATYKVIISRDNYERTNLEFSGNDVVSYDDGTRRFAPFRPNILVPSGSVGTLEGTIKNTEGGYIKDAVISLIKNNKITTGSAKTNRDGEYCLNFKEAGSYTVFVYHPAYYDNEKAVKEIMLKKGENKFDFELELIVNWERYDLYLRPLDQNGTPLEVSENPMQIWDELRFELYTNYDGEIVSVNDKSYLKFTNVPCGRRIRIRSYRSNLYQTDEDAVVKFDCSNNAKEYFYDIKLKKSSVAENDPAKPDVYGKVTLSGDYCLLEGGIYCDPNIEEIKVVLQKYPGPPAYSAVVDRAGNYRIVDVKPGGYSISTEWSGANSSSQIEVGTEDLKYNLKTIPDQSQISTLNINGVKIEFVGASAQKYKGELDWNDLARKYATISGSIEEKYKPPPLILPIFVIDNSTSNAFYVEWGCKNSPAIYLTSPHMIQDSDILGTLYHEYGHHVYTVMQGNDSASWNYMFEAASKKSLQQDCVFQAIRDSNLGGIFDNGGHPWDNEDEFFASFFVGYFYHHERLLSLIKSLPEGSECRNVLEFAWQFFSEKVAKTPGESIDTVRAVRAGLIRLYSNDNEIFGPIVGGKIGNEIYTSEQIKKGLWKQSVYAKLSSIQKARVQATIAYSKVANYLKLDPEKYKNQILTNVVKFNQFIDKILGTTGDRGSIEGVVKGQSGGLKISKANVIVIIGKKMAVTDSEGKFRIDNIKIGEQKVKIVDAKTQKTLNIDLKSVSIKKDKTIKRFFTVF